MATLLTPPPVRAPATTCPCPSPRPAVARAPGATLTRPRRFAPPAAAPPSDADDSPAAASPIAGASTLAELAEHDKLIDRLLGADGVAQVRTEEEGGRAGAALLFLALARPPPTPLPLALTTHSRFSLSSPRSSPKT